MTDRWLPLLYGAGTYLIISFVLGCVWYMLLFPELYKKLNAYTRLDKPIFSFGVIAMLLQGVSFAFVYRLLSTVYQLLPDLFGDGMMVLKIFWLLFFAIVSSFTVFAEAAKQNIAPVSTWVIMQVAFCLIQTILVCWGFYRVMG